MNPVQSFLSLPGIRMVPGTFVASQLTRGTEGVQELSRRPVMSFLDVLPYAGKVAKGTKVAQGYESYVKAALEEGRYAPKKQATNVALTRKLTEVGKQKLEAGVPLAAADIELTKLGQATKALGDTRVGMRMSQMFGPVARDVSRIYEVGNRKLRNRISGKMPLDPSDVVGQATRDWIRIASDDTALFEKYGIDRKRVTELTEIGTVRPKDIAALPANEQAFLNDWRRTAMDLGRYAEMNDMGISSFRGEFYRKAEVDKLLANEARFNKRLNEYMRMSHENRVTAGGRPRQSTMDAMAAVDPRFAEIRDLVNAGRYQEAAAKAGRLRNYNTASVPGVTDAAAKNLIERLRKVSQAEKAMEARIRVTAPARFDDMIYRRAADKYLTELQNKGLFSSLVDMQDFVQNGRLREIPGWNDKEFMKHSMGVRKTWQSLAAAGEDPIFLHRVTIGEASGMKYPSISDRVPSLQQAKERLANVSPHIDDASVALSHQGFDILRREVSQNVNEQIIAMFGVDSASPYFAALQDAIRQAESGRPGANVLTRISDISRRDFVPFDPNKHAPMSGVVSPLASSEQIFIPRQVARVLEDMNSQGMMNLRTFSDPVTKTWRIALLPLSPRWHFYNIVGGGLLLTNETGLGAWKHLSTGYQMARAALKGEALPVKVAQELKNVLGSTSREEADLAFRTGMTAKRMFQESQNFRLAKGLIQKSFDFNQFFDDMYRSMAYLYGHEKGLTKGMSAKAAETAGVDLARKVLQDTAALTPFERNVLRQVFPFYSWNSHIVRYAMKFPYDHPIRASLVGGIARQVEEDMGDGATKQMMDLFSFGKRDAEGNQFGFRTAAMNPFTDVGTFFSLAGWLGATSPIINTVMSQMGIDTQSGTAELYPTLRYDAETGRLRAKSDNPVTDLFFNTLPQATFMRNLLGANEEFNRLLQTDPQAAGRMIASNAGLPVLGAGGVNPFERNYNPDRAYLRAELKRQEASGKMVSEALRSGRFDQLVSLGVSPERVAQLKEASAQGLLEDYNPQVVRERLQG
jgi:hypothetical protein